MKAVKDGEVVAVAVSTKEDVMSCSLFLPCGCYGSIDIPATVPNGFIEEAIRSGFTLVEDIHSQRDHDAPVADICLNN